jgi:uncharacterized membrane protein
LNDLNRFFTICALVLILVASVTAPKVDAQFTIRVAFETPGSGLSASVTIDIYGPISGTYGPISITTGTTYYYTITGVTEFPGYYTVKVTLGTAMDVYTGSASFQVVQRTPFDFSLTLSPSTVTVKKGETAKYSISVTFSDPYYQGTTIKITDVSGIPGIKPSDWTVTPGLTGTLNLKTSDSTPPGTYTITVTGYAEGVSRSATATLVVEATFDYSLTISPSTQTVNIGEKTAYTITVALVSGTPQIVSLSLAGLPGDVQYLFSTPSSNPSFTSTLTVDASTASSTGTYTITVTGSGGGLTRTTQCTIVIKEAKDFSLAASPSTVTVKQGEKAVYTVDVQQVQGFNEVVTFVVSGLPDGATYTFSPTSGKPAFSSTLVIETSTSTPEGNYTITIDGSGGGKTHSASVTLSVKKNPLPIPGLDQIVSNPTYLVLLVVVIVAVVALATVALRKSKGGAAPQPARLAYCDKCGAALQPSDEYCGSCGTIVKK